MPHLRHPYAAAARGAVPAGERRTDAGALARYRSRHHLLTAWEAGRTVQTAALNVLLRLLRDPPGSLAYLKRHAA